MHQGFSRAFSWLWYGSDPILDLPATDSATARERVIRHAVVAAIIPTLWLLAFEIGYHDIPILLPFIGTILLLIAVVGAERGTWEALHRTRPTQEGKKLRELMTLLQNHENVIFTGHSLGGALATIAFAVYLKWCKSDNLRNLNALLITFGCPRVGDKDFVKEFEDEHRGKFCHVVHSGDPVAELPPGNLGNLCRKQFWRRGALGIALLLLRPLWVSYSVLYQLHRPGEWSPENVLYANTNVLSRFRFANHDKEKYLSKVTIMGTPVLSNDERVDD